MDLVCSIIWNLSLWQKALQVTIKPNNGKETLMDILVMENIFYNRDLFPVYDLKGSERARLARDDPSDPTRVLMDQNLIQSNLHDPILVSLKLHEDNCLVIL